MCPCVVLVYTTIRVCVLETLLSAKTFPDCGSTGEHRDNLCESGEYLGLRSPHMLLSPPQG